MIQIDPKRVKAFAVMGNAVLTKTLLIAGGYYGGVWLDRNFHTAPYLMLTGIVVGMSIGLWWILFLAKRLKL